MASSSTPRKEVRFADSPNESYNYDSDSAPSPIHARAPPFTFPSTSAQPQSAFNLYNSRSLNETPSPVYNPIALPSSPIRDYLQRNVPPLSPIQAMQGLSQPAFVPATHGHGRNDSASSTSSYTPLELPPTPNLRPVELPPVDEAHAEGPSPSPSPLSINIHPRLLYGGGIDVNLTDNLEQYIASLPLERAVTPPRPTMILRSNMLPWKVHVEMPALDLEVTVQDVVAVLYSALKMHVTDAEINYFGEARARSVYAACNRRIEGKGSEERRKGPRRIDFLSRNTRFRGLMATEDPNIWKICLEPMRALS